MGRTLSNLRSQVAKLEEKKLMTESLEMEYNALARLVHSDSISEATLGVALSVCFSICNANYSHFILYSH